MSVKAKMTAIADEIRELSGTSGAMGLDAMATNLGDANDEVVDQADLIAQIASALEGKASGGGSSVPEFSTVTFRLADVNLSDYYNYLGYWEFCFITANYINETYTPSSLTLFENNNDNKMDKSEITITVPTNSTIFLDFEAAGNHYISAISSNNRNELYDIEQYKGTDFNISVYSAGCRFQTVSGAYWDNIPIFGDTEVIIKEYD